MLGFMKKQRVHYTQVKVYHLPMLGKEFIIRCFKVNESTFLYNSFFIQVPWVDFSTFLPKG
jgi:ABC-type tungstate transport system permease subunit